MNTILVSQDIVARIHKYYENKYNGEFRPHLGASQAGDPCQRKLYYNFRHALIIEHDGRLLKLFQRGHSEEFTFEKELNQVGFRVVTHDDNGKQFRLGTELNKHVSGSGDGFAQVLADSEHFVKDEWVLIEMKTHNDKSFKKLVKDGVRLSKPLHYSQMQLYMRWSQLTKALYIAVNKNDDSEYVECIKYDENHARETESRAIHIAESTTIPVKLHNDPSHFECRFCDYHGICHGHKFNLNVTCRTCVFVKPLSDGSWTCQKRNQNNLHSDLMAVGCNDHIFHPDFLSNIAVATEVNDEKGYIAYEFLNGLSLKNGTPNADVLDSETVASIVTHGYEAMDENALKLINDYNARLVK